MNSHANAARQARIAQRGVRKVLDDRMARAKIPLDELLKRPPAPVRKWKRRCKFPPAQT
jgi:hypothetical protein